MFRATKLICVACNDEVTARPAIKQPDEAGQELGIFESWCTIRLMTNRPFKTGESRYQASLLPPRMEDYVGPDNPVRAIESYVCALDLAKLGFRHADRGMEAGQPPYDPGDLLKLYLYGYINQVRSSRRLEREACRNLELIWLLRNLRPGYRTIANFRRENWAALKAVNRGFVLLVRELGLVRQRCCDRRLVLSWRCQQGEHLYAQEACRTDRTAGPGDRCLRQINRRQ